MKNIPTLTLIRGLPGSGKSTLAQRLCAGAGKECKHVEADMFFIDATGVYQYKKELIKDAHIWCLNEVKGHLSHGVDVVVSNTFTQLWEMEPYFRLAGSGVCKVNVLECKSSFGSIHNVSPEVMTRFRERWQEFPL